MLGVDMGRACCYRMLACRRALGALCRRAALVGGWVGRGVSLRCPILRSGAAVFAPKGGLVVPVKWARSLSAAAARLGGLACDARRDARSAALIHLNLTLEHNSKAAIL